EAHTTVHVRFTPESGQAALASICPLCAKTGLTHRSKISALIDHLVGARKRLARTRNRSSAREMLNARWQHCPSAHLFLPDRRPRGREIPVVEAPNRNAKVIWT